MQSLTQGLIFTLIVSFALVFVMMPVLRKIALKTGFVDMPNARKLHKEPIPVLGGAGIFFGFLITVTATEAWFGALDGRYYGIVIGGSLLFLIGLVDDFYKTRGKDFPAWPKFLTQIVAACVLIKFGVKVSSITIPWMDQPYYSFADHGMEWLSWLVTIFWIVGITNMLNFLDGVDGLAAGIASISATTLLFVSLLTSNNDVAFYAVALIGACLSFLRHNFHPARIFMGDAGATFLGFTLAAIAVDGAFKSATFVSVIVPVLALGVPIFDTVFVIIRRIKEKRPIHHADKSHTFHTLMKSGMTQVQTVSFMYLLGICFSLASIVVLLVNK
ncbi:MraY family glycosyltransferase [Tumebacillus permanentifrigoris]|uniref:UDP-GlcNAc:undecaprenyl-phosphate GlcNAc-1-phosphate transferase n=1 Tax=Tumebacillus permanentifrigoris TaxID=378543 RepID=A0A316DBA7_9BACL|nr:MraY family glycosyltransferase [Tumebacillus permanentifrigoris]PWK14866.1 UDP-GlcNAc:undecaprenyl-phosphate GlcNAc-1-phosphate transferase [Tumebacillus permanentifrigoris]